MESNTIITSNIDNIKPMLDADVKIQRLQFYQNKLQTHYHHCNIKETDTHIYCSESEFELKFGKKLYLKQSKKRGFTFDKKTNKLKMWFGIDFLKFQNYSNILKHLGLEFILNEQLSGWLTKSILEKCLVGKITNPTQFCKAIIKSARIECSPELLRQYIKNSSHLYDNVKPWVLKIAYTCKNLDYFLMNKHSIKRELLMDMINQANALGVKIDLKWSENRMKEEHKKWTYLLMEEEINTLEDITINYNSIDLLPNMQVINTQKDLFREGKLMHHCVYTNYWRQVREKKYLVLHYEYNNKPITIGIGVRTWDGEPEILIDQIYSTYNSQVNSDAKLAIGNWFTKNKDQILYNCFDYVPKNGINEELVQNNDMFDYI